MFFRLYHRPYFAIKYSQFLMFIFAKLFEVPQGLLIILAFYLWSNLDLKVAIIYQFSFLLLACSLNELFVFQIRVFVFQIAMLFFSIFLPKFLFLRELHLSSVLYLNQCRPSVFSCCLYASDFDLRVLISCAECLFPSKLKWW